MRQAHGQATTHLQTVPALPLTLSSVNPHHFLVFWQPLMGSVGQRRGVKLNLNFNSEVESTLHS